MSTSAEDPKLTEIINSALNSSHQLVQRGLAEELQFRKRTESEIHELLLKTQCGVTEKNSADIQRKTLEQVNLDLELAEKLKTTLTVLSYTPTINPDPALQQCTYPFRYNQLVPILEGTKAFLESNFTSLFRDQEIPNGYRFDTLPNEVTRMGPNERVIYGSSKNTFLKTALLETFLATDASRTTPRLDLMGSTLTGSWIDGTAMAHVAPVPDMLNLEALDPRFAKFTFSYHDDETPNGLLFPHSGYTFGGDRVINNKTRIRKNKAFAPEDCSSWLEKICGGSHPFTFTTGDQLYFTRKEMGMHDKVPPEWLQSDTPPKMEATFEMVPHWQQDPQKYVKPGQIYCHRRFNLQNDPKMEAGGVGGHTALVLGFKSDRENSQIVTLGYNRDMPAMEGFGVQEFPLFPSAADKTLMLFSVKGQKVSNATLEKADESLPSRHVNYTI